MESQRKAKRDAQAQHDTAVRDATVRFHNALINEAELAEENFELAKRQVAFLRAQRKQRDNNQY